MDYIKLIGNSTDIIVEKLKCLVPVLTEGATNNNQIASLIDLSDTSVTTEDISKTIGIPVIILNANHVDSINGCIAIFDNKACVLHYCDGYTILQVMDEEVTNAILYDLNSCNVEADGGVITKTMIIEKTQEVVKEEKRDYQKTSENIAFSIETAIASENLVSLYHKIDNEKMNEHAVGAAPTDLPKGQNAVQFVTLKRNMSLGGQIARGDILIQLWLVASFNPKCKYLRVNVLGGGFHPGTLLKNDAYDRGYFHKKITTQISLLSDELTTYCTSPKNVNNVAQYTEGSSFTIGVDINANPGFRPSYTISDSHTTTISDFRIINNSKGNHAEWNSELSLVYSDPWNLFEEKFFRKAKVKGLPDLATSNNQPFSEAVYYVSGDYNKVVDMHIGWRTEHRRGWVTGKWIKYTMRYQDYHCNSGYWENNPWKINFNAVQA